jgi:exodeoxyribonuclease III
MAKPSTPKSLLPSSPPPSQHPLKLVTWNVNGLRSVLDKTLPDFIQTHQPDVLCLQETKVQPETICDHLCFQGYQPYFYPAEQKGYSGTAIFTKVAPQRVSRGIGHPEHDQEGRVLTAEFPGFTIVNVYTPNSQRELARLDYRLQWDTLFREYLGACAAQQPVLFCGDLNVAHQEIDLANPKSNRRNAGFTDEERQGLTATLESGFVDAFRHFHPDRTGAYSWWTYRMNARAKNVGWRLDYWCCSPSLLPRVRRVEILAEIGGSDHCPVLLELV